MAASELAHFFDELYRTGRASAGPLSGPLDPADPGLADLDRVLGGRVDWHLRGLPGRLDVAVDLGIARAAALALYELLCLAIEPANDRLVAAAPRVEAVLATSPNAAATLDALFVDAPRMRKRFEAAGAPHGPACLALFDSLMSRSPMTLLRFCGIAFKPPADLACVIGSHSLEEEAVALLAFPGGDAARLGALGVTMAALLGAGSAQTHLALRAYEAFSFFCARTVSRQPAGGARHIVDVRAIALGGALGPDEQAIGQYLRPLGIVAQSPRLDEVVAQHPRLDRELLEAARAIA
jgi:hypothetical protein